MTREQKLEEALREVMAWIENWGPSFIYDEEWPNTKVRVDNALNTDSSNTDKQNAGHEN